jgi:hypothetical protein
MFANQCTCPNMYVHLTDNPYPYCAHCLKKQQDHPEWIPTKHLLQPVSLNGKVKPIPHKTPQELAVEIDGHLFSDSSARDVLKQELLALIAGGEKDTYNTAETTPINVYSLSGYLLSKPVTPYAKQEFALTESLLLTQLSSGSRYTEADIVIQSELDSLAYRLLQQTGRFDIGTMCVTRSKTGVSGGARADKNGHHEHVRVEHHNDNGKCSGYAEVRNDGDWHGKNDPSVEVGIKKEF